MIRTAPQGDQAIEFCALYEHALPDVYGYLLRRCGSLAIAEDLTSETAPHQFSATPDNKTAFTVAQPGRQGQRTHRLL